MSLPEPREYIARINGIVGYDVTRSGVDGLPLTWKNHEEAKTVVARLRGMQKDLKLLKQEVSALVSAIKSEFTTARTQVGKGFGDALAAGFFGRRNMSKVNASQKDHLRRKQLSTVAPYEDLKANIDRLIAALDSAKFQVETSPQYQINDRAAKSHQPTLSLSPLPPLPLPPAPPVMRYYIYLSDEVKGPYTFDQILVLRDTNTVSDETLVCQEGSEDWKKLENCLSH